MQNKQNLNNIFGAGKKRKEVLYENQTGII